MGPATTSVGATPTELAKLLIALAWLDSQSCKKGMSGLVASVGSVIVPPKTGLQFRRLDVVSSSSSDCQLPEQEVQVLSDYGCKTGRVDNIARQHAVPA